MTLPPVEATSPTAPHIIVTAEELTAELYDGRIISVPLAWYPRLTYATQQERENWEFIGMGQGLRWPDLDEDISIEGLIAGRKSGESARSFQRWLEAKQAGLPVTIHEIRPAAKEDTESA